LGIFRLGENVGKVMNFVVGDASVGARSFEELDGLLWSRGCDRRCGGCGRVVRRLGFLAAESDGEKDANREEEENWL